MTCGESWSATVCRVHDQRGVLALRNEQPTLRTVGLRHLDGRRQIVAEDPRQRLAVDAANQPDGIDGGVRDFEHALQGELLLRSQFSFPATTSRCGSVVRAA